MEEVKQMVPKRPMSARHYVRTLDRFAVAPVASKETPPNLLTPRSASFPWIQDEEDQHHHLCHPRARVLPSAKQDEPSSTLAPLNIWDTFLKVRQETAQIRAGTSSLPPERLELTPTTSSTSSTPSSFIPPKPFGKKGTAKNKQLVGDASRGRTTADTTARGPNLMTAAGEPLFTETEVTHLIRSVTGELANTFLALLKSQELKYERVLHQHYHLLVKDNFCPLSGGLEVGDDFRSLASPGLQRAMNAPSSPSAMSREAPAAGGSGGVHSILRLQKLFESLATKHAPALRHNASAIVESSSRLREVLSELSEFASGKGEISSALAATKWLERSSLHDKDTSSPANVPLVTLFTKQLDHSQSGVSASPPRSPREGTSPAQLPLVPPSEIVSLSTTDLPWSTHKLRGRIDSATSRIDHILATTIDPAKFQHIQAERERVAYKTITAAGGKEKFLAHEIVELSGDLLVHPSSGAYCFSVGSQTLPVALKEDSLADDEEKSNEDENEQCSDTEEDSLANPSDAQETTPAETAPPSPLGSINKPLGSQHGSEAENVNLEDTGTMVIEFPQLPTTPRKKSAAAASSATFVSDVRKNSQTTARRKKASKGVPQDVKNEDIISDADEAAFVAPALGELQLPQVSKDNSPASKNKNEANGLATVADYRNFLRRQNLHDVQVQASEIPVILETKSESTQTGDNDGVKYNPESSGTSQMMDSTVQCELLAMIDEEEPSPRRPSEAPSFGSWQHTDDEMVANVTRKSSEQLEDHPTDFKGGKPQAVGKLTSTNVRPPQPGRKVSPSSTKEQRIASTVRQLKASKANQLAMTARSASLPTYEAPPGIDEATQVALDDQLTLAKLRQHQCELSEYRTLVLQLMRRVQVSADRVSMLVDSYEFGLTCGSCLSVLTDPCLLWPCGHSFCRSCLTNDMLERDPVTNSDMYRCKTCNMIGREGFVANVSLADVCAQYRFGRGQGAVDPTKTLREMEKIIHKLASKEVPFEPVGEKIEDAAKK